MSKEDDVINELLKDDSFTDRFTAYVDMLNEWKTLLASILLKKKQFTHLESNDNQILSSIESSLQEVEKNRNQYYEEIINDPRLKNNPKKEWIIHGLIGAFTQKKQSL